jgi:hypothetical protein
VQRWLVSWGGGIVTSGALFPPLPIPFRVDYPEVSLFFVLFLFFFVFSVFSLSRWLH